MKSGTLPVSWALNDRPLEPPSAEAPASITNAMILRCSAFVAVKAVVSRPPFSNVREPVKRENDGASHCTEIVNIGLDLGRLEKMSGYQIPYVVSLLDNIRIGDSDHKLLKVKGL